MTRYIIDSWAWFEYFGGTESGKKVKRLLEQGDSYVHAVTISEVISKLARKGKDITVARNVFASFPQVVQTTRESAVLVGQVHAEARKSSPKFSLADAHVLEAARRLGLKVLTGDPDFNRIAEAEFL